MGSLLAERCGGQRDSDELVAALRAAECRKPIAEVRPGALVDGAVLFEADLGQQVDNMEGISAHRSGADTVLTMISDNNFSPLQRTMLLQFSLAEE